jgi:hypothetical protein
VPPPAAATPCSLIADQSTVVGVSTPLPFPVPGPVPSSWPPVWSSDGTSGVLGLGSVESTGAGAPVVAGAVVVAEGVRVDEADRDGAGDGSSPLEHAASVVVRPTPSTTEAAMTMSGRRGGMRRSSQRRAVRPDGDTGLPAIDADP